jgi:MFS family permease
MGFLRSLNPQLPRSVQALQVGGLANAFGNGIVLPFTFIYLHNVRGIGLGMIGLILATNGAVSLGGGAIAGVLVDRVGGKWVLGAALVLLAAGYGTYAFVNHPWQGFLAATVTGVGNGAFWPSQSTLIAGLTPESKRTPAFAMQRVVGNLGIGIGALTGGLIASTSHPRSFELLFLVDGATFLVYLAVLWALVPGVLPTPRSVGDPTGRGYRAVLRNRAFRAVLVLNAVFIFAGFAGFDLVAVYAKNQAGVSERAIGLVFLVNTLAIVIAQLPVAKLVEGRRRMATLGLMGFVWAGAWLLVPVAGVWLRGASAAAVLGVAVGVFGLGECLHGAVQAPLVTDLAEPGLVGRYMALSALSWQVAFMLGPAVGGFAIAFSPHGTWIGAAAICAANGLLALTLEPLVPIRARRTPGTAHA